MSLKKNEILSSIPKLKINKNTEKQPGIEGPYEQNIEPERLLISSNLEEKKNLRTRFITSIKTTRMPVINVINDSQYVEKTVVPKKILDETNDVKLWSRADRPSPPLGIGKTDNEMRDWIRKTVRENELKSAKKCSATILDYMRKAERLDAKRDKDGVLSVGMLGNNRNTFYANHAALVYVATERARSALNEIDKADRTYRTAKSAKNDDVMMQAKSDREKAWCDLLVAANDLAKHPAGKAGQYVAAKADFIATNKNYDALPEALKDLVFVPPIPPAAGVWKIAIRDGEIKPVKTKRSSKRSVTSRIQKMHPDWREKVFDSVSDKWKLYTAIAIVTGCRPEEIDGIKIGRDPDHLGFLSFEIAGAKTGQGHGIKLRKTNVREKNSAAFSYLYKITEDGGFIAKAPTLSCGDPLKNPVAAFRNAINEAGRCFLNRKNSPIISPYCFRHSFASDIKADGFDPKTLAIALGHSTTRTQRMYGRSNDGVRGRRELYVDMASYNIREQAVPQPNGFQVDTPAIQRSEMEDYQFNWNI